MFGLGESLSFQLTLTVPGEETLTKTFGFSVAPQEIQHMPLDGVLTASPAVFYVATPDETSLKNPPPPLARFTVWTPPGAVHAHGCCDEKRPYRLFGRNRKTAMAALLSYGLRCRPRCSAIATPGSSLIALCDVRGHVYLLTGGGEIYRELDLDEACAPGQLHVHPRAASQGDLLVLGFPSGRLMGIPTSDALPWEFSTEEAPLIGDTQAPDSVPRKMRRYMRSHRRRFSH